MTSSTPQEFQVVVDFFYRHTLEFLVLDKKLERLGKFHQEFVAISNYSHEECTFSPQKIKAKLGGVLIMQGKFYKNFFGMS